MIADCQKGIQYQQFASIVLHLNPLLPDLLDHAHKNQWRMGAQQQPDPVTIV